ncbi:Uncharacterised protein [Mycobacteroides abscessus subsp. abscessus]|nr:Uncharacterised protein [Mycobacteroides abscessus subsp. abscessus]
MHFMVSMSSLKKVAQKKVRAIIRNVVKKLSHSRKTSLTKLSHWHKAHTPMSLNMQLKAMYWL